MRPNVTVSDLWTNALAMRKAQSEHACLKSIAVKKFVILILVTMVVDGCYGKVDYSTGWSQWFDNPHVAWASGEAEQLMF